MTRRHSDGNNQRDHRRRQVIRTAVLLGAVAFLIYLIFIGRGIWNYLAS